jgi:O-antigen/teichoic acid export membrane protein
MDENKSSDKSKQIAKTVAKGGGWLFIGMLLGTGLDYATRIIIARYLGVSGYGLINLGLSVMIIASVISLFGLESGIARFIAYYGGKNKLNKVKGSITSGLQIIIPISIFSSIIIFIFAEDIALKFFKEPELTLILKIFAIVIPLLSLLNFFIAVFRGFKKVKYMIWSQQVSIMGIRLVLLVFFILLGSGILGISIAYSIGLAIASLISVCFVRQVFKKYTKWSKTKGSNIKKELFKFSSPLMASQIFGRVRNKADTILVGYFLNSFQVGLYNAALPISYMLKAVLNALNRIYMPSVSELYAKGQTEELNNTYKRVARWTFYFTLPAFLTFVFFPIHLLQLLFGANYKHAWIPLVILSVGMFINCSSGSFGETLIAIGKTKVNMFLTTLLMASNITLNILLIPRYGITGAAISTAFSLVLTCLAGLVFVHRYLGIQPFSLKHIKFLISSSVALALLSPISILMPQRFVYFFPILLIPLLYMFSFVGFFLWKGFDQTELYIIKRIWEKLNVRLSK